MLVARSFERTCLVRESVDRDTKCPCQTEITQFQLPFPIDQQILRLQIAVEDPVFMAEGGALEQLVHKAANGGGIKSATIAMSIHILLEISFTVFEDQDEFCFGVYHVV